MALTDARATIISAIITGALSVLGTLIATGSFEPSENLPDSDNKPFAGVWDYDVRFTKFHGLDEEFDADGYLIALWNEQLGQYSTYHTYTINRSWETETKIITAFADGVLAEVDEDGWPDNPFDLTMTYVGRTGLEPFRSTGSSSYTLQKLTYTHADDSSRIESMNGEFKFINQGSITTEGTISISRRE